MSAPSQSPAAEEMRAWDIAEKITGPCTCIDAYKFRGLIAPDCAWHHMAEEIAAALLSEHDRLTAENARLRILAVQMTYALDEALPFILDDTLESVQIDGGPHLTRADIGRMCSTAFDAACADRKE